MQVDRLGILNLEYQTKLKKFHSDELIGSIIPDEETIEWIGIRIREIWPFQNALYNLLNYKEAISVFLVGCGFYHYNDHEGGFWQSVETKCETTSLSRRYTLVQIFKRTIQEYKLNDFEYIAIESYKNITPILCHSGIPLNCYDDLFDKISQAFDDRYFSSSRLADEFLYSCRYNTAKAVIRHIEYMRCIGKADDWLINMQEMLSELRKSEAENVILKYQIRPTIIYKAKQWVQSNNQRTSGKSIWRITSPELLLDTSTNSLEIELPEQYLPSFTSIVWGITDGVSRQRLVRSAVRRSQTSYYAPSIFPISNLNKIEIDLQYTFSDCQTTKSWVLKDEDTAYLFFNKKGNLIKRLDVIQNKGAYLLLKNDFDVDIDSRFCAFINSFKNYNLWYIDTSEIIGFHIHNTVTGQDFEVTIQCEPEIIGGKPIFDISSCGTDYGLYYELPFIQLSENRWEDWHMQIMYNDKDYLIPIEEPLIDLNHILNTFEHMSYGRYRIALTHSVHGRETYRFNWLPKIQLIKLNEWYWPSRDGYKDHVLLFESSYPDLQILNSEKELIDQVVVSAEEDTFDGIICINQEEYPFSLRLRPFTWEIVDDSGDSSAKQKSYYKNRTNTLTLNDIILTNLNIIIKSNMNNTYNAKLALMDDFDQELCSYPFRLVSTCQKSLMAFIDVLNSLETSFCSLMLEIENGIKVLIAKIKLDSIVFNMHCVLVDNGYFFTWEENGPKKSREMKILPLISPWDPESFSIEDQAQMFMLEHEYFTWPGFAFAWIESSSKVFFQTDESIITIPNGEAVLLYKEMETNISNLDFLSIILDDLYSNRNVDFGIFEFADAYGFEIIPNELFYKLIYSFIFFKQNKINIDINKDLIIQKLTYYIKQLISKYGWSYPLEMIISLHLSDEITNDILCDIGLLLLKNNNTEIKDSVLDELMQINPHIAILASICSNQVKWLIINIYKLLENERIVNYDLEDTTKIQLSELVNCQSWETAKADLVFQDHSNPAFVPLINRFKEKVRFSSEKDELIKFAAWLVKLRLKSELDSAVELFLEQWIRILIRDYRYIWCKTLFNILSR